MLKDIFMQDAYINELPKGRVKKVCIKRLETLDGDVSSLGIGSKPVSTTCRLTIMPALGTEVEEKRHTCPMVRYHEILVGGCLGLM